VPYSIEQTEACPAAKPFGVTKDSDGSLMGCHVSREAAQQQVAALYASEAVAAAKYDHIDFSPPAGVREEAARGLEWRREHKRGGTEVGVARARDLSNGKNISPETARRMKAYFDRHEVDKQGEGFSPGEDGFPSAGRIAWALWGGDAGQAWASKLDRQMDAADNADKPQAAASRNEIRLYGAIGYPGMTSQLFKTLLADANPAEEVVIRIDSEGGSVFDGFGIYDALKAYEGRTRAVVESSAFSIASFIAMAADTVEITENGYLMIHNPYMQTEGDYAKLAKDAEQLAKLRDQMLAVYSDRSGKSAEEMEQVMRAETFISALDAVAEGYVDRVLPTARKSAAAAKYQGNMPERVQSSLNASGHSSGETADQKEINPMSSNPKPVATVKFIQARFGKASSDFIVKAVAAEMTEEQVAEMYYSEMMTENEQLKAKIAAMEEEMVALKAKAQEMTVTEVEEEDDEHEKMVVMPAAKARPGVAPVASVAASRPVASAKAQWEGVVASYTAQGLKKADAARKAAREHAVLRDAVIAEANNK
jgi:ATP-dependent protease ClpP protease subunit